MMMSSAFSEQGPDFLGWSYLRPVTVCLRGYGVECRISPRVSWFIYGSGMPITFHIAKECVGFTDCLQDLDFIWRERWI